MNKDYSHWKHPKQQQFGGYIHRYSILHSTKLEHFVYVHSEMAEVELADTTLKYQSDWKLSKVICYCSFKKARVFVTYIYYLKIITSQGVREWGKFFFSKSTQLKLSQFYHCLYRSHNCVLVWCIKLHKTLGKSLLYFFKTFPRRDLYSRLTKTEFVSEKWRQNLRIYRIYA